MHTTCLPAGIPAAFVLPWPVSPRPLRWRLLPTSMLQTVLPTPLRSLPSPSISPLPPSSVIATPQPCTTCATDTQPLFGPCSDVCPSGALSAAGFVLPASPTDAVPPAVEQYVYLAFFAKEVRILGLGRPVCWCHAPLLQLQQCAVPCVQLQLCSTYHFFLSGSTSYLTVPSLDYVSLMQVYPPGATSVSGVISADALSSWLAWEGYGGPQADLAAAHVAGIATAPVVSFLSSVHHCIMQL